MGHTQDKSGRSYTEWRKTMTRELAKVHVNINKYATYLSRLSKTARFGQSVDKIGNIEVGDRGQGKWRYSQRGWVLDCL